MRPVEFGADANSDVDLAHGWYETQRPGLGTTFVAAVGTAVGSVERYPEAYPVVYRGVRRVPLERFPFCLYYRVEPERSVVLACVHAARDPDYWQSRLDD